MCRYCVGTVLYTAVEKAKGVCVDRQGLVFAHKQCTLKCKGQNIFWVFFSTKETLVFSFKDHFLSLVSAKSHSLLEETSWNQIEVN